jgi:LuxR family maltose regulon positive regulatory protein
MEQLLTTKLFIPPTRPELVSRPRLITLLTRGLNRKLTLISAPAGFGKTTLVTEWLDKLRGDANNENQIKYRIAWLSLEDDDNDLVRFLFYFIAALNRAVGQDGAFGKAALSMLLSPQPAPVESILTSIINEFDVVEDKYIFVLDDYHVIETEPVDNALNFLIEHLPPQIHLVITTREDPRLTLPSLRAKNQLTELRAADLRFTTTEASAFLNQVMDLNLSDENIAALEAHTEGWITGLQLAALALQGISMQGRTDASRFVQSFTGNHRFVLDYLVEEVLQGQPEYIHRFLLQTSILERLNASLCEAVTEQAKSRSILETLERGNLFVIPLDDRREWYRYHHLFTEVLKIHLLEQLPDQVFDLHQRASVWYEQNDMTAEAIHHSLAAEDWERAAGLIELAHPAMDRNYQSAAWLSWAKALPEDLICTRPVLCVDIAWALLDSGEIEACEARLQDAEGWLGAKDDMRGFVVDEVQFRSLPASIATARAYRSLALGDVSGAVKYAQRALILTPEDDSIQHLQALSLLGVAQYTSGDLATAESSLADLHTNLKKSGDIIALIGITYLLADIRVALGRLHEAEYSYQQALQLATAQREPPPVGTSDLYRGLSELSCEWGNLAAAAGCLQTAKRLGDQAALTDWQHRLCVAQARLKEVQGDWDSSLTLLDEAEQVYIQSPLPDVRPVPAMRARIWIKQGRLGEALTWKRARGLSVDDDLSYLREFEHITLARLLVAQYSRDRTDEIIREALALLSRLLQAAESGGRSGSVIEILVVQALAHQVQGDISKASEILARALTLAEPQGYVRIFVEEGEPMMVLLREATKRGTVPNYVRQLQASFENYEGKILAVTQPLIEPLSERELEVLRMLKSELSGPEIARHLMISLNTLRTHTKNIYNKLGVNKRRSAVRCAEELDLF